MSTVRVYKSTDSGAPPHPSGTRGSMAALLRACLVTGYGSGDAFKAPAGWEEPFTESGNYAVFRALTGARQFFQIDDNQANADVTIMNAYESMSDSQMGSGLWASHYFGKHSPSTSVVWVVVADETTCYVLLEGSVSRLVPHGFGEYRSLADDDPYNSFVAGHGDSSKLVGNNGLNVIIKNYTINNNSGGYGSIHRGFSGAASSFSVLNTFGGGEVAGEWYESDGFSSPPVGCSWLISPLIIKANSDISSGVRVPRGILRGMFAPLAKISPPPCPEELSAGGKNWITFVTDANNYDWGRIMIDLGSWE